MKKEPHEREFAGIQFQFLCFEGDKYAACYIRSWPDVMAVQHPHGMTEDEAIRLALERKEKGLFRALKEGTQQ
jgi:hypothetical protein